MQLKSKIASVLFERLFSDGICSVSLVGSFCDKDDLNIISDIDTIVVCEDLTAELFHKCVQACKDISGDELGFPEKKVYVNSTFGPLKFDSEDSIVIHLMIYDIASHRDHVNQSPFTCFDWERSQTFIGKSLSEIYPVLRLQPSDFLNARRGIQNYLEDLKRGVISYREYAFDNGSMCQQLKHHALNERHKAEYAYHIIKNLICNYCKLIFNRNELFIGEQLVSHWKKLLPETAKFIEPYQKLESFKNRVTTALPEHSIEIVQHFLSSFENEISNHWDNTSTIDITRHQRTSLNDGTFLGQGRDPEIEDLPFAAANCNYDRVFSSPMKRAVSSAKALCPENAITTHEDLSEINYGLAEGMTVDDLHKSFPEIPKGWAACLDPRFPSGENSRDVLRRAIRFLKQPVAGSSLIVSHNVVLRCLVGSLVNIEFEQWHLINIPHMEIFCFKRLGETFYPNFSPKQRISIRDAISKT